jgi:hypothetical protein
VSIYSSKEIDEILNGPIKPDIIQLPISILDKRLFESKHLQEINKMNIKIQARSIFLQGLLLMERGDIPNKFETWKCYWDRWDEWVRDNNTSRLHGCLSYCLSHRGVDRVVVGVDKKSQLEEIVAASNVKVIDSFPDLTCSDPNLINPANW